jgi:DNA mismatch repair protein MutL
VAALAELAEHMQAPASGSIETALLSTIACHTAVRAGQSLAPEEMQALLAHLEQCRSPRTCPHGRPTMILLGAGQIERMFGRAG